MTITGISTPIGGLSWEYTENAENADSLMVSPGRKIKVFISSICGVEKYDKVRAELKDAIERTQLADVYTFEGTGASTLHWMMKTSILREEALRNTACKTLNSLSQAGAACLSRL